MDDLVFKSFKTNVSLKDYTSLKIGGLARYLVELTSLDQLPALFQWIENHELSWIVLGKGSNVLVSDDVFDGVVIINKISQEEEWVFEDETAFVWVGAGENLAAFAARCSKNEWSGIEFACGIPGTIGGGVAMNAGAHGRSLAESLVEVELYSKEGLKKLKAQDLDLRYRHSRFLDFPEIVVAARFKLVKDPEVKTRLKDMTAYRLSTQPWKEATAGCFFRNPEDCFVEGRKCSAGFLIEKAGLKGFVWKGAQVSEIHANFLVNNEDSSAQAFIELCQIVRERVHEKFGVWLQGEVRYLKNSKEAIDYV